MQTIQLGYVIIYDMNFNMIYIRYDKWFILIYDLIFGKLYLYI